MRLPKVDIPRVKLTPLAIKSLTRAYFRTYRNRPASQETFLRKLIRQNSKTAFGQEHQFIRVSSVQDFQAAVPVHHYDDLYPRIERCLHDEKNVLIRGSVDRFATSSGTTWHHKYIPVTNEALKRNHFRAGTDLMMYYGRNNPQTKLRQGKGLVIGGTFCPHPFNSKKKNVGYISAILQKTSPLIGKMMKQPKAKVSYLWDWAKKVDSMIEATRKKNITSISGSPARCSAYLEKAVEKTGVKNVLDIWKNMELVIRGGMAIDLYKNTFQRLLPSPHVHYYQVYNASEWFFALQHENDRDDMLLLVEHSVFYEFIPLEKYLKKEYDECLTLSEVETGKPYVILITNNAGLRRYVMGDVIEFTGLEPHTIKVTGRTKYYIDVASECTPLQPIEESLLQAASQFWGEIDTYTVAPGVMKKANDGHYEVAIEWKKKPTCTEKEFASLFDRLLCQKHPLYSDERHDTKMLLEPKVHFVPENTFHHWLEKKGKLWWQHKLPKVSTNREIMEEIVS